MEAVPLTCPRCSVPTSGLRGAFCRSPGCEAYVLDIVRELAGKAPAPAAVDPRPEEEIRQSIVDLLRALGYGVWDTEQGYREGGTRVTKGLPDLFVAGPAGAAAVEVKSAKGKQTPEQKGFERAWTKSGGTYFVWRSVEEAARWHESAKERAA